jgi:RNA polymerase sigma factor (sigma-70 family)
MKTNKDIDRLILENEKLVHYVAKRYKGLDQYEDLAQEGMIGLIKAAQRFDPTKGFMFSSFATPFIKGEILHYLRDKGSTIKIPRNNARRLTVLSIDAKVVGLETPVSMVDAIPAPAPENDEEFVALKDYIVSLSEDKQNLFEMALNGVTKKDIAARLGITAMTATRRIAKLIDGARLFFGIKPELAVIKAIDRIEVEAINSVETIFELPASKNIWDILKDDIAIAFEAYLKSPCLRSIDRCLESLYLFGLEAIKSKYFYLAASVDSDSLISWEDLLHESICKVRQYLLDSQINSSSHLMAMLYTFAKYACWHEMRRAAKYTSLNKPIKSTEVATLEDFIASTLAEPTPERSEDLAIIESALAKLPTINKRVIELVWIERKTLTQAALAMEKPLQFVSQIVQKSRIIVARELTGRRMSLGY